MTHERSLDISKTINTLLEAEREITVIDSKRTTSIILAAVYISIIAISIIGSIVTGTGTPFLLGGLILIPTRMFILNSEYFNKRDIAIKQIFLFLFTEFVYLYDSFKEKPQTVKNKL